MLGRQSGFLNHSIRRLSRSKVYFVSMVLVTMMAVGLFAEANIAAELSAENQIGLLISEIPSDYSVGTSKLVPSGEYLSVADSMSHFNGVLTAEPRSEAHFATNASGAPSTFSLFGLPSSSIVYSGVKLLNGSSTLDGNSIYIWSQSSYAFRFHIGETIPANFTIYSDVFQRRVYYGTNFTVAGFVDLADRSVSALTNSVLSDSLLPASAFDGTVALVNWDSTFSKLIDFALSQGAENDPFTTWLLIYVDASQFSSLDLQNSDQRASLLGNAISNVAIQNGMTESSQLLASLQSAELFLQGFRAIFILAAFPELVIAWYLTSSMFSLSAKRNRRETGLHALKGFSASNIRAMYLMEACLVASLATSTGILVGAFLVYATSSVSPLGFTGLISWESVSYSLIFGILSTLYLAMRPIKTSIRTPTIDLLKEEDNNPKSVPSRISVLLTFIGIFELVVILSTFDSSVTFGGGGLFTFYLIEIWETLSLPLIFLGPLVLLFGLTALCVYSGLLAKFSTIIMKPLVRDLAGFASKPLGVNTKLVFRLAILIGTITAYLVLGTGFISSQNNFLDRQAQFTVGADISINFTPLKNETLLASRASAITAQLRLWQGISSVTAVYTTSFIWNTDTVPVKIVEPSAWLETAYFEPEWFTPQTSSTLFQTLQSDSASIILSKDFRFGVQNTPSMVLPFQVSFFNQTEKVENLRVVGFVGPLSATGSFQSPEPAWSFVSMNLFGASNPSITLEEVLVKLTQGTNPAEVESRLAHAFGGLQISSSSEAKQNIHSDLGASALSTMFGFGVVSVVFASFVGIIAITIETVSQEERDYRLLAFKGMSYRKITLGAIGRFMSIVAVFAPIGAVVGYFSLLGSVRIIDQSELGFIVLNPTLDPFTAVATIGFLATCSILACLVVLLKIRSLANQKGKALVS